MGMDLLEWLKTHPKQQHEMYDSYVEYFHKKNSSLGVLMTFKEWQHHFGLDEQ